MEFGNNGNIKEVNTPFGVIHIVLGFNEPMLVAKEIALILGFKDPKKSLRYHLSDNDKSYADIFIGGRTRSTAVINRSGMYKLAMKSILPIAKEFCDWVANVLVQIADTGNYTIGDSPQDQFANAILNPDMNYNGYISEEDVIKDNYIPSNPYEVMDDGRMVYEALVNYCKLCNVKLGIVINEFVRDFNAIHNTNLRLLTTKAFNNNLIEKNSIFDYIKFANAFDKAFNTLMYMTDKYFHFMEYERRQTDRRRMITAQQPQPIYNIYVNDNAQANINSDEVAKFSKEHGNYPYIAVKDGKPLMDICHKVNKRDK